LANEKCNLNTLVLQQGRCFENVQINTTSYSRPVLVGLFEQTKSREQHSNIDGPIPLPVTVMDVRERLELRLLDDVNNRNPYVSAVP